MSNYKLVIREINGNTYYSYTFPADIYSKRKRVYGKTEYEVLRKISEEMERRAGGGQGKPQSDSFLDHLEYYFKWSLMPNSKNTNERQKFMVEKYVRNSNLDKNITEITTDDVNDFFHLLVGFVSVETMKELFKIFEATFRAAQNNGVKIIAILDNVELPKRSSIIKEYIPTTEEYLMLRDYCIQKNDIEVLSALQAIITSFFLGLKIEDTAKIKCKDVDLENNTVKVEDRIVKIRPEFKEWINTQEQVGNYKVNAPMSEEDKEKFLFGRTESDTEQMSVDYTKHMLSKLVQKCGLPLGISTKTLERNYVLMLLQEGKSTPEIAEETGLSSKTILKYNAMFNAYHLI